MNKGDDIICTRAIQYPIYHKSCRRRDWQTISNSNWGYIYIIIRGIFQSVDRESNPIYFPLDCFFMHFT